MTKQDDPNDAAVQKKMITLGPRFDAEFGIPVLEHMAKELVYPESVKDLDDEDDLEGEGNPEAPPESQEDVQTQEPEPPRKSTRKRKEKRDMSDLEEE